MLFESDFTRTVSMRLSEVFDDICVNEKMVLKRRNMFLLQECMQTLINLNDENENLHYIFGSQSEGTTTNGLNSDIDKLICFSEFNVIQNLNELQQPDVPNLLMIQDETVSPGYCLIQCLGKYAPFQYDCNYSDHFFIDRLGRLLLKNTYVLKRIAGLREGSVQHGPAFAEMDRVGFCDVDRVGAFRCKSWPQQAKQWLQNHDIYRGQAQWPSFEMKRYCKSTGCFVVPVGSTDSATKELEWRISTSLSERCMVFNMNISQIRCFVLMKMILKTFIKPKYDTISTYICKTVLFHCITNTPASIWRENNLITCFCKYLLWLYKFVSDEKCPHFFIKRNNLLKGKITSGCKQFMLALIHDFINSNGKLLLEIKCNSFGERLMLKMNYLSPQKMTEITSGYLLCLTAVTINATINTVIKDSSLDLSNWSHKVVKKKLVNYIFRLRNIFYTCQVMQKKACKLIITHLCSILGSVLASQSIQQNNIISDDAQYWMGLGLYADVASPKLKQASIFYCVGNIQRTETVLNQTEAVYDLNVVKPFCSCNGNTQKLKRRGFFQKSDKFNLEDARQLTTASCVRFFRCEMNCVPYELKYELFRSTKEEKVNRESDAIWMDFAVIDSLPFLYFLQFKTYSRLEKEKDKQRALFNLARTMDQERNIGHLETAFNLLGKCLEQEGRARAALECYLRSLNLRKRNNAARLHICVLLAKKINRL
ncbi:uncharacterized protein LOC132714387 [Ruditapes philippinarum]|uniref:uncharacterized protein LOC132714387 n=1 Tax=Ruditapes philippinarum TaxID=129788 RepID=UPI00295BDFB4|nr:uncharacterized protein LOC132714387 [Ruditapes philippinarum]